jgi:enoyl-CoA hydratase/carnithine racemase
MSYEAIIYERRNAIAIVTLNRPHRGNSYDAVLEYQHLEAVHRGEQIREPVQHSEDRREGSLAFAQNRKPVWKGR